MKASEQLNNNKNKSRKVGDTFGTIPRGNSKKKRRTNARKVDRQSTATPEPDEPTYDSKLLLDLPFDLFVEVCSHLEGKDLLSLAKINTVLRNILLSRGARSIWSSLRRKLGFPLPDGLSEIDFALFEYSYKCQFCEGRAVRSEGWIFLRVRTCWKCSKEHTISSKGLKKAWPGLHGKATQCVRFVDEGTTFLFDNPRPFKYLVSDLAIIDEQLKELEEQDDIAVSLLQSVSSKGSSTRSRRSNVNVQSFEANHVENFVKERQEWVKQEQETTRAIIANRKRLKEESDKARTAQYEAQRKSCELLRQCLENEHGWNSEETARIGWMNPRDGKPKVSIEEDPEAWSNFRSQIRNAIDKDAAENEKRKAQNDRKALLRPYYDDLEFDKDEWDVFPSFDQFARLKSIKALWHDEGAVVNDEIWRKNRSKLFEELDTFVEQNRIEAIRYILAANRGLSSTSSLSKDPADYPEETFGSSFFSRSTSLFVHHTPTGSGTYTIAIGPWPYITTRPFYQGSYSLQYLISPRHIAIFQALAAAAGLKAEQIDVPALDALGDHFIWTNDPRKSIRKLRIHLSWTELLYEILRRGLSARKIGAGERIEIEYCPDDTDDQANSRISDDNESDDDENEAEPETEEDEEGGVGGNVVNSNSEVENDGDDAHESEDE
ncbi:uncharacterized protein JCM6883_002785 [Sporobolomyces salmoneus]|uniref:uncharacterized protein n=1 Tax=Sporobolomyces salmoneus TaxID=183962 RepID=UPI00317D7861